MKKLLLALATTFAILFVAPALAVPYGCFDELGVTVCPIEH